MKKSKIFIIFLTTLSIICITQYSFGSNFVWSSKNTTENKTVEASSLITNNTNSLNLESGSAILIEQNSRSNFI